LGDEYDLLSFGTMNKPKLIVFDLAGTTVNDNKDVHRVLQRVFKKMHMRISIEEANQIMGIPKPIAIKSLLKQHKYPFISELLILEMHHHFVMKMTEFYLKHPSVCEKEGASEIFSMCKAQGIKVVVDTGFDRSIVVPLLDRMKWEQNGLIDGSVTSDEVAHGRPYPDMIYRAMELTGVTEVASVAKVGDTMSDLQEGTSAGCGWVIGVTTGSYTREQLSGAPHTHLIEQLSELKPLFNL
jgi:phosphonatase-like hydrolase